MEFKDIFDALEAKETPVGVVGLGYVGLPLALALSKHFTVVGFDINETRIAELNDGIDVTGESDPSSYGGSIEFTDNSQKLSACPVVIIAAPTPITKEKKPNLAPLESAIRVVGENMHKPTVVVVESTVYPGATETVCEKILESELGLCRGSDFKIGYSPERINPGDREHTLDKVTKIVSAEDEESLSILEGIYKKVTTVYAASNIATAEAAKVIENIQRDLNIALVNELAIIFERMGINTNEVIDAAATKWNFSPFRPGLVGGHCIGVDPYYLTHKAGQLGYNPEVILSGRRLNDAMGGFIASKAAALLSENGRNVDGAKVVVFGITFKEDIRDIRNSRVIDIVSSLKEKGAEVLLVDPLANREEVKREYGLTLVSESEVSSADAFILAVAHKEFLNRDEKDFLAMSNNAGKPVFVDVKSAYEPSRLPGFRYWSL